MCKKPFEEIDDDHRVVDHVINGGRPTPFPEKAPKGYIELMTQGWSDHAGTRPTIEVMRERLRKLAKQDYNVSSSTSVTQNTDSNSVQDQPLPPFEDIIELHKQMNYTRAFPLFQQYAALSHKKSTIAKFYCGYYLYHGKFGIKDEEKALEYLRQAADAGIIKAQVLYAEACLEGSTYDPKNGIKYLKKAVNQENQSALEMWAKILYNGEHDQEIDLKEAFNVWKKAVNKGSKLKLFEENLENQENQENQGDQKIGNILTIVALIILISLIIFYD